MNKKINAENMEDGIDLLELLNKIKEKYRIIYISLISSFLLAILIVLFSPKIYKTQISLLAESNSKSAASSLLGSLGGFSGFDMGSLMGIDLSGGGRGDALTPDLYPDIVKSTTFLIEILAEKITEPETNTELTVARYLNDFTKPSIFGLVPFLIDKLKSKNDEDLIVKNIKGQPLKLSKKQEDLIEALSDIIDVEVIKSGGGLTGGESKIINVSVEAQNAQMSAYLAVLVVSNLKEYIINYNTGKAKNDLEFIDARYHDAREKYYKTQNALAEYDDSNINVILASVRTNRQRLETENSLAASLYNGLAQKLEQSKIIVQDRTPVFTVIEPAKIPLKKSKPKTSLIIISMLFVGAFVGVTIILTKEFILSFQNKK